MSLHGGVEMTTKRKGAGVNFDNLPPTSSAPAPSAPAPTERARAYTALGLMGAALDGQLELEERAEKLEAEVEKLKGERGAQFIDAALIRPSRWAHRHTDSFNTAEFLEFKNEIEHAGGNVQPVKVRPLTAEGGDGARYELVFGLRRHRACLELGMRVLAVVQPLDDRALLMEMEWTNRGHANLSAWEQGMAYRRALDAGLFPSSRRMAAELGVDLSALCEALQIADLPAEVVSAFLSPTAIQLHWGKPLAQAVEHDHEMVLQKAREIAGTCRPAAQVFELLAEAGEPRGAVPPPARGDHEGWSCSTPTQRFDIGHGHTVEIRSDGKSATLQLDAAVLPPAQWKEVAAALRKVLAGPGPDKT